MRNDRNLMVNFKPGEYMRNMNLQSARQAARKKNKSALNKSRNLRDLLVTSPDALPLSYKRLMGAPATTFLSLRMTTTKYHTIRKTTNLLHKMASALHRSVLRIQLPFQKPRWIIYLAHQLYSVYDLLCNIIPTVVKVFKLSIYLCCCWITFINVLQQI